MRVGKSVAGPKSTAKKAQGIAIAFSGYDDGSTCPTFKTVGWAPTCDCVDAPVKPCTVLDPFGGSGTVGAVAQDLGRDAVLVELNPAYVDLAHARLAATSPQRRLFH